ncbi:MAG: hypothetical protein HY650_08480 [Acidobacteria bacterium]|nr:hypothetical protein [Acidobacteriota bacterium]
MSRRIAVVGLYLCLLLAYPARVLPEQRSGPLTKPELIELLRGFSERKQTQDEVAAEIERRGIQFDADRATTAELRTAGATDWLVIITLRANSRRKEALKNPQATPVVPVVSDPYPEVGDQDIEASIRETGDRPFLEQVRHHALAYGQELPNFLVKQEVKRYLDPTGTRSWRLQDSLFIDLSYRVDRGETFKLLSVNGGPPLTSYEEIGGSTSTGEFGSMLISIFAPESRTSFVERRLDKRDGRNVRVYSYTVLQEHSRHQITDKNANQTIVAGYHGELWIDERTKRVLRIETIADSIPPSFSINLAESTIEYDWVKISDRWFLLPVRAEVILGRGRERYYTRNVIDFRLYRKFEARLEVGEPN